jgi:hypothetical protein
MNARFDVEFAAGAILSAATESNAPVDAWSLDELEQLSDLESVRQAWGRQDEPGA